MNDVKLKYIIIDLSKKSSFKKDKKSKKVSIGQFGKIINLLKENKCKKEQNFLHIIQVTIIMPTKKLIITN